MGTYDFYIDKRKNNIDDKFIDIKLDYPIEIKDYEYLKVKLVDFKYLNTFFNISGNLINNQFNIRRYSKTYIPTLSSTLYFNDTGFFDGSDVLTATETIEANIYKNTITSGELSLCYYNETLTTTSLWVNILKDTTDALTRKMSFKKTDRYFEIKTTDNIAIKTLDVVFYKDTYVGGTSSVDVKFQRYNPTSTSWEDIDSKTITLQSTVSFPTETISKTFTYTTPLATLQYRLICDTDNLPFDFYILKLQANKQNITYDAGTVSNTPNQTTLTIQDGFYKSSTFTSKLNDLLAPYNITTSINTSNNKLKLSNNNNFIPTLTNLVDENYQIDLVLPNIYNMKENWGIIDTYEEFINIPLTSYFEGDTNINLINLSKIIITTNLNFTNKTHNEIISGNNLSTGIGNILQWIDADEPPYSCIKYINHEDMSYKIQNKTINNIILSFYNEKSQNIILDNTLIHLQIKKLNKKSY